MSQKTKIDIYYFCICAKVFRKEKNDERFVDTWWDSCFLVHLEQVHSAQNGRADLNGRFMLPRGPGERQKEGTR